MTVAELISKIRIKINDTDSLEFPDSEILGYINESIEYIENILSENNSSITSNVIELISSATAFPDDVLRIDKIIYDNKVVLKKINGDDVKPGFFSVFNNEILINSEQIPCKMYYMKRLNKYDDIGEELDLFTPLIAYIEEYSIIKCLNRLEYNLTLEEQKLEILRQKVVTMIRHRDGFPFLKRYDKYV